MRLFTTFSTAAALAAVTMTGAMAQTLNATGTLYVGGANNVEGTSLQGKSLFVASNTGDPGYAAFTLLNFGGIKAPATAVNLSSLSLSIVNYPSSAFDISGPMDVFLTSATSLTGAEGYTYQAGSTDGIGSQLGTLVSLGQVPYNAGEAQGNQDTFNFTLSKSAQSLLAQDLSSGDVELAFGVGTTSTTTARFDGTYYNPVTLTLTPSGAPAVPEASTTVSFGLLLAFGLGSLAVSRRRKAA